MALLYLYLQDAEKIVERVLPRLSHVNSAVVLSAVKVVLRMMDVVGNEDLVGEREGGGGGSQGV
jgi:vesicle coat complex subunit